MALLHLDASLHPQHHEALQGGRVPDSTAQLRPAPGNAPKNVGNPWETHGKPMENPWKTHGKPPRENDLLVSWKNSTS